MKEHLLCLLVLPHAWNCSFAETTKDDWVYLIKLHLQDATGEVDAALFDKDADEFFQVNNVMLQSSGLIVRQCHIAFTVSTLTIDLILSLTSVSLIIFHTMYTTTWLADAALSAQAIAGPAHVQHVCLG